VDGVAYGNPEVEDHVMTCNVGGGDRVARFILGIAALVIGFSVQATGWRVLSFVVAAVALLTAVVAYCPVNRLLHVNTRRHDDPIHLPKYK
jgi:hypothetical protein